MKFNKGERVLDDRSIIVVKDPMMKKTADAPKHHAIVILVSIILNHNSTVTRVVKENYFFIVSGFRNFTALQTLILIGIRFLQTTFSFCGTVYGRHSVNLVSARLSGNLQLLR